jgi:hypothetical protein
VHRLLALSVVAGLTGCGASEQQKVVAALRASDTAWARGDLDEGCAWLTERARKAFLESSPNPRAPDCREAFTVDTEQQTAFGVSEAELIESEAPRRVTSVRVDGDTAVVNFSDGRQSRLSTAIGFSPTADIGSPQWRPSFLPVGGRRISPARRRREAEP